jgi:hypothetical protein
MSVIKEIIAEAQGISDASIGLMSPATAQEVFDTYVAAALKALPDEWAKDSISTNRIIIEAFAAGFVMAIARMRLKERF